MFSQTRNKFNSFTLLYFLVIAITFYLLQFVIPMQLLVHMEWWSCFATQASQVKQWFVLIGFFACEQSNVKQSRLSLSALLKQCSVVKVLCSNLTMQEVQNILGSRQPASANTNTF